MVHHVISLAQYATVYTRSWAVDSMNGWVRLKAENDQLRQQISLLREELRVKVQVDGLTNPSGTTG